MLREDGKCVRNLMGRDELRDLDIDGYKILCAVIFYII